MAVNNILSKFSVADLKKEAGALTARLSNTKKCPRCGQPGSGPHERWVRNSRHKRYEPYLYFSHRVNGKQTWCYLGKAEPKKPELDNSSEGSQ